MIRVVVTLLLLSTVALALPTQDSKYSIPLNAPKFNPDTQIIYHLFTRQNPTVSQPLVLHNGQLLGNTNYNSRRRTIVLIHGWMRSIISDLNTVSVPAFLEVEDVNVIAVDWSAGADTINYIAAVFNTVDAGRAVARFLTALNEATGSLPSMYHIVGHSLGAHMAGIVGRNMGGEVAYITALDPASPGWNFNNDRFHKDDGVYTEVIHTNAGLVGYLFPLGKVDFYPNGGVGMPGCGGLNCEHKRSVHYFGETLASGGFTGTRCDSYMNALAGSCSAGDRLQMGGLDPKTGISGIFYLETNAAPPFSQS